MPPLNDDDFARLLHDRLAEDGADLSLNTGLDDEDAEDLALLREAIDNYKAETLHFAEQQSATMPVPRVNKAAALWDSTPRWAVAATAVLALAFTTVVATHRNSGPVPMALAAAPTAQALQADNRLLLSVDEALTAGNTPTEADLGLTATPAHPTKPARLAN